MSNDMVPKAQGPVSKAGYLFERRSGRMLQSWNRRYFTIDGEDFVATTRNPKVCQKSVACVAQSTGMTDTLLNRLEEKKTKQHQSTFVCVVFEWQTATIDDFVSKSFLLHGIVL
jgi:hypothetical protein